MKVYIFTVPRRKITIYNFELLKMILTQFFVFETVGNKEGER